MGMEITINSLEEMCDLMCDNKIPEQKPVKSSGNEDNDNKSKKPLA